MVSIAFYHGLHGCAESFGQLRRWFHPPRGGVLLIHKQSDFVTELYLIARRLAPERANHVVPCSFAVNQILSRQIGVVRYKVPYRSSGVGLGAFHEDASSVEAEITILESKISESATGRLFIYRCRLVLAGADTDAVHIRIVEFPEMRRSHRQLGFDECLSG